ncbi:MAG: Rho termination factor N-terminal domain-containing protein, partial [Deltaproteobacteria bacterium]|nr:Rho termination factor N-terminal domain-containing protein [Deltaproteobacteria bacterium]
MNLKELKGMRIGDLTEIAKKMNVDGAAGLK